jgi:hypothetical protein
MPPLLRGLQRCDFSTNLSQDCGTGTTREPSIKKASVPEKFEQTVMMASLKLGVLLSDLAVLPLLAVTLEWHFAHVSQLRTHFFSNGKSGRGSSW